MCRDQKSLEANIGRASPDTGLTEEEKIAIRSLQQDFPIKTRPFEHLAESASNTMGEERLIHLGRTLKERGILRRYAAVLRHLKAGFKHNAMTVWKLSEPQGNRSEIDPFMQEPAVSHLYTRTVIMGKWEYPLFAMIHAKHESDLMEVIQRLSLRSKITDYKVLKSLEEYKKQRVVYFSSGFEKWHAAMNSG